MPSNTQKHMSGLSWLELAALSLLWGGSFLSVKMALGELGPLTIVLHRTGWAMIALWLIVVALKLPLPRSPMIWLGFLGMGVLNNIIPFALMAWGQQYIDSGLTSIFNASTAFFGILVAAIAFRDEKLTARKALGVSVGLFGIMITVGIGALLHFDLTSLAQIAVIAGTISYALAGVWARIFMGNLNPIVSAAGMLSASTILLFPAVVYFEGMPKLALSMTTVLSLAYLSILATALAYVLYYRVLNRAGSGNLMLCTLLVAPVAIVLGAVAVNEQLEPRAIAGFSIVAIGLLIIDGRLWTMIRKYVKRDPL